VANPRARRVVFYTTSLMTLSPACTVSREATNSRAGNVFERGLDWPGRGEGPGDRESNTEVAAVTYLSPVPSVRHPHHRPQDRRGQSNPGGAMGVKHGFTPDHNRIDHWRGGP
jgi:hypothetical protein